MAAAPSASRALLLTDILAGMSLAAAPMARQWLGASERMEQPVPMADAEEAMPSLSTDALSVKIPLQDLKPVRYTGHPLTLIQRTGYLSDWTRERWGQTTSELAGVRRPGPSLPSDHGQVMDAIITSADGDRTPSIRTKWASAGVAHEAIHTGIIFAHQLMLL